MCVTNLEFREELTKALQKPNSRKESFKSSAIPKFVGEMLYVKYGKYIALRSSPILLCLCITSGNCYHF